MFSKDIIASKTIGDKLALKLSLESSNHLASSLEAATDQLLEVIEPAFDSWTQYAIVGRFTGSVAKVFDGTARTKVHEGAHWDMDRSWRYPEKSFDESWAYVWEDVEAGKEDFIDDRHYMALKFGDCHRRITARKGSSFLPNEEDSRMKELIGCSNIKFSEKNWPAFQTCVNNMKYYAFLLDVVEKRGKDLGRRLVLKAAEHASKTNDVNVAIDFLARQTGLDISRYDFVQEPVWKNEIFSRGLATVIKSASGEVDLVLWSHSKNVAESALRIFYPYLSEWFGKAGHLHIYFRRN